MIIRRNKCLLCGIELEAIEHAGVQRHPKVDTCGVIYTDSYGISLRDDEIALVEALIENPPPPPEPLIGVFDLHPPIEYVLGQLFEEHGLRRLGGASTGKGWSSYSTAQRCLYLWHKRYVERQEAEYGGEDRNRAIGTVLHVLTALYYANMLGEYLAITPEACRDYLLERANPAFVNEGWRIYSAYRLYYNHDDLEPLAVEYNLKDPRTGDSTRYDLIAFVSKPKAGRRAGTYIIEHKSSGRFDFDTLDSWANDGEAIGEAALWKLLGMDKRFGSLQGVIVNIIGKQQEPKFHRTLIAPESFVIDSHLDDLRRWDALIALCRSANFWPRSRANCVNRYGRCDWWDHCAATVS